MKDTKKEHEETKKEFWELADKLRREFEAARTLREKSWDVCPHGYPKEDCEACYLERFGS